MQNHSIGYDFCLQERLKAIQVLIHDIDNDRRRSETNLNNLYRLQEKYGTDEKSNSAQHKMRSQYKICMNDAAQEENVLRQALSNILEIRNIRNERRIQVSDFHSIYSIRLVESYFYCVGKECRQQGDHPPWCTDENVTNFGANIATVCEQAGRKDAAIMRCHTRRQYLRGQTR